MRDLEGGKSEFGATIKMVYDDEFLYISATLPENTLRATLTKRDSVIFHDDDFEVFIDPCATGRNYLELEIYQLNTVCPHPPASAVPLSFRSVTEKAG